MSLLLATLAMLAELSPIYCVVDVSGGEKAVRYPVSYLASVPSRGWTDEYKTSKIVLRRIEAGAFTMTDGGRAYPGVAISKPYYIGVFEVTQRQWELVTGRRPSFFANESCYMTRPVESVSYSDIQNEFVARLKAKCSLAIGLPTEAQWEYACRAGTNTEFNVDLPEDEIGRFRDNGAGEASSVAATVATDRGTAEVGSYSHNAWGLYDMHGNVREWCLDWHGTLKPGVTDPQGADYGTYRVLRDGCWCYTASASSASVRGKAKPSATPQKYHGLRLASAVPEDAKLEISEVLNASRLKFENPSDVPWFGVSDVSHDGSASMRSGAIGNKGVTTLRTRVTGEGVISFWWKASSEADEDDYYDYCEFKDETTGEVLAEIGGITDWQRVEVALGEGEHLLSWSYRKDKSDADGEDCVWLDEVNWATKKGLTIWLR